MLVKRFPYDPIQIKRFPYDPFQIKRFPYDPIQIAATGLGVLIVVALAFVF